jgi:hypothetical protein
LEGTKLWVAPILLEHLGRVFQNEDDLIQRYEVPKKSK